LERIGAISSELALRTQPDQALKEEISAIEFCLEQLEDVDALVRELISWGYPPDCLLEDKPNALFMIKRLIRNNEIGRERAARAKGESSLKILFLAANPMDTSRLDLEEELSAIEAELRGVVHRDRISFVAKHAVRV
jgi:hypothetical protein